MPETSEDDTKQDDKDKDEDNNEKGAINDKESQSFFKMKSERRNCFQCIFN